MTKTFASLKENERQAFQTGRKENLQLVKSWFDTHFHEIFELSGHSAELGPLTLLVKNEEKQRQVCSLSSQTGQHKGVGAQKSGASVLLSLSSSYVLLTRVVSPLYYCSAECCVPC